MSAFRRAAQAAFERAFARAPAPSAEVDRASIDVTLDGSARWCRSRCAAPSCRGRARARRTRARTRRRRWLLLGGAEAPRTRPATNASRSDRPSSQAGMQRSAVTDRCRRCDRAVAETASAQRGDNATLREVLERFDHRCGAQRHRDRAVAYGRRSARRLRAGRAAAAAARAEPLGRAAQARAHRRPTTTRSRACCTRPASSSTICKRHASAACGAQPRAVVPRRARARRRRRAAR